MAAFEDHLFVRRKDKKIKKIIKTEANNGKKDL